MEKTYIDKIGDENNDEFSNDDLFNIMSWGADPSVRELLSQYSDGDILKPELQRNYVWDKKEASRFIESLLLGLPVPSIFLADMPDSKKLIVDGYQRLTTLYFYIEQKLWKSSREIFRLINSPLINERWRNKSFDELCDSDKRRLKQYTIHAIIFVQKSPQNDSGLFQIFERINTSGKPLNAQEIRNCVYQGDMNTLLIDLNNNKEWRELLGTSIPEARMQDIELILRFFSINTPSVYNSDKKSFSLKQLMNQYMSRNTKMQKDDIENHRNLFCDAISFIRVRFGEEAFYNLQNDLSKYRRKLYPTVFDSLMIATSIALQRGYSNEEDNLKERKIELLRDPHYRESITQGTMQTSNILNRISMTLHKIYDMNL